MKRVSEINVFYENRIVGTLALYKKQLAVFQYDASWLKDGFSISPISLPLENRLFIPNADPFDGLFGVFNDSLPDGWGRLLTDRYLRKNGVDPETLTCLDRLALTGESGMGAVTYMPKTVLPESVGKMSLDEYAQECSKILLSKESSKLDELVAAAGSSGGARPKILTSADGEDWIIKFPSSYDMPSIGKQEYEYALCAVRCGIEMAQVRLFPSEVCEGYFGTKRFDRIKIKDGVKKVHMVSVSGLLETSHRVPNLDYDILMRLTLQLTGSMEECKKLFRLMCFNVFAHNRDDHSKNFTFLYDDIKKQWVLSPAYDLTYSSSIGGEHATMVHGNGSNPGMKDILDVASMIGLNKRWAKKTAEEIKDCVEEMLGKYLLK